MRILILNASPKADGTIGRMMDAAGKIAAEQGTKVDVCRLDVRPCTGCMACRKTGNCILPPDDAHRIARMLPRVDLLVVGTPVYWANMNGQLKVLFDRLVPVFMGESRRGFPQGRLRGVRAIVVTACSTPFPFDRLFGQSGGAQRAVKEVLRTAGMRVSSIRIAGTKYQSRVPGRAIARLERLMLRALASTKKGSAL